jgi:predicted Zn-dependent protease
MKPTTNAIGPFLVLVIIAIFCLVAVFKNTKFPNLSQKFALPSITPTPVVLGEVFRDPKGRFEFQYPNSFTISGNTKQNFLSTKPVVELIGEFDTIFTVSISSSKSECDYVPRGLIDNSKEVTLNGQKFTKIVASIGDYTDTIYHRYASNTCFELVTGFKTGKNNQLIDNILSSFKFAQ